MYHKLKTTLYHGTVSEIEKVDVELGRSRKDFGRGFYMSVSKNQAVGMLHKKYREAVRRSRGKQDNAFSEKLYEILLDEQIISELNVKIFETADLEWLIWNGWILFCCAGNRGECPITLI